MESYFRLAGQYHAQSEPAFCGIAVLCMILNRFVYHIILCSQSSVYLLILKEFGNLPGGGTGTPLWH